MFFNAFKKYSYLTDLSYILLQPKIAISDFNEQQSAPKHARVCHRWKGMMGGRKPKENENKIEWN